MADSESVMMAANAYPPGTGAGTVTAGSTSTAEQDLSAYEGKWLAFICTERVHVSFGVTGIAAADTGDFYFPKDTIIERRIPRDGSKSFFRAIRKDGTDSIIIWAEVGE